MSHVLIHKRTESINLHHSNSCQEPEVTDAFNFINERTVSAGYAYMEQNNKHNSSLGSDCFRDTAYNNFEVKS
jgi:hypothetical protein